MGLVAVTGSDAVNVAICLAARERNPRLRTICRIFDPGFASKLEASGTIDRALSASRIASPTFAASAVQKDVRAATVLRDALLVFSEVAVEDEAFRLRPGWTPLLRARGMDRFVPFDPSEPLRAGDRLLVQSTSPWVDSDGADGALEPPSHPAP
ncbi:MAG: NAD-binding protein [Polyangiaceae bacterium]